MKDVILITPPFTQLNTPYPATAYLKRFLKSKNIGSFQIDLGLEVILEVFSGKTFHHIFEIADKNQQIRSDNCQRIFALRQDYLNVLDPVISFLQGKNPNLARQICSNGFLPQASRFDQADDIDWAFGPMGFQDKAKHLATLFLEDLSDFIVECVDSNFGFSRYAERLGQSANSFDDLYNNLQKPLSFIDKITLQILGDKIKTLNPKLLCFSVPFPGNLYSAFRCAQFAKKEFPNLKTAMGGGFPNTELRSLSDSRVLDFFDFISLDDGELPLELIVSNVLIPHSNNPDYGQFKRTFVAENRKVVYKDNSQKKDYKQSDFGTPDYSDLLLDKYISVIEVANPMHSLWSDGRWNKLTMVYGCYWGKCTFCDTSLPYIKNFDPGSAKELVDRMEQLIQDTGESGFHFVDEAAHPALMKSLALEIIKRKLTLTWWTNIRFEKSFSKDLCLLLKASGCIAVSGGLEVASDRLLALINKGVSVEQVAQVTRNFTEAGIMVHAYLMYGFPTQTVQETIDSLEMVRQMFETGIIQSGFWHQFALTAHSPIGFRPEDYGINPRNPEITFANNDVQFTDSTGIDHSKFSYGLKKSLFNYMHDIGFEFNLQDWFDFKIPKTKIPSYFIEQCLQKEELFTIRPNARIVWLGNAPDSETSIKSKKGKSIEMAHLKFYMKSKNFTLKLEKEKGLWFVGILNKLTPDKNPVTFAQLKVEFESQWENFEIFWYSKPVNILRKNGLLAL